MMQLKERFAWAGLMLVLAIVVVMTAVSFDLYGPERPYQRAMPSKSGHQHQPGVAPADSDRGGANREKAAEPDWANPHCENPRNHDEADLCEQRRMAKAADKTFALNAVQILLGMVGAALVVAGLYYARQAALAALKAATYAGDQAAAAVAQTKVAEDALMKVQRPYVFIFDVERAVPPGFGTVNGHVPFTIANYGQTPAVIEWVASDLQARLVPKALLHTTHNPFTANSVLRPEEARELMQPFTPGFDSGSRTYDIADPKQPAGLNNMASFMVPKIPDGECLYLRIAVGYRGPLTQGHETGACWEYDFEESKFVPYGGDRYNYTR